MRYQMMVKVKIVDTKAKRVLVDEVSEAADDDLWTAKRFVQRLCEMILTRV